MQSIESEDDTKNGLEAEDNIPVTTALVDDETQDESVDGFEESTANFAANHTLGGESDDTLTRKLECSTTTLNSETISFPGCDVASPIKRVLCQEGETLNVVPSINSLVAISREKVIVKDEDEHDDDPSLDEPTDASDLSKANRRIWIVTSAALPWMTGTAVNPLLRALYLTRGRPTGHVTLVIPWLKDKRARRKLYGKDRVFCNTEEQEAWIRQFSRERAQCRDEEKKLRINFYDAIHIPSFGSIFPTVDICALIPDEEADVCILEEPEHLNWFRVAETRNEEQTYSEVDHAIDGVEAPIADEMRHDRQELGWAHKFRHSIGIIHTNYSAYMTQYAFGTSFIAAPAIGQLSSIVVRAYCHKVLRLSAVLPSLAPNKEVTCNVHGVRSEFLHEPKTLTDESLLGLPGSFAPIYFIGKVIWAKGFDKLLELQDLYKHLHGDFFPIDVYGSGDDELPIKRAFFGRSGQPAIESGNEYNAIVPVPSEDDMKAARVFDSEDSLRTNLSRGSASQEKTARDHQESGNSTPASLNGIGTSPSPSGPTTIISDLTTKSMQFGFTTSAAVYSLTDMIVKAGHTMTFTAVESTPPANHNEATGEVEAKSFFFDPPKSTYEWRRHPIPARFLGRHDHCVVRDIPPTKIFLNMSTTEVLCTTSAEALAMGKFVILPKHPSNEFFLQFPNCLAYESLSDCVEKIVWALQHEPTPLSDEFAHRFSWEGANERLESSSIITKREMRRRIRSGMEKSDVELARFHVSSTKKGRILSGFFSGAGPDVNDVT